MFNDHISIGGNQPAPTHQLTPAEFGVIQQLRRLQHQRSQHIPQSGRQEPLGMLSHEGRQYLEIRQNFAPILVPSHMLTTVREFLSLNLPAHIQQLRGMNNTANSNNPLNPQVQSPPQSPPYNPHSYFSLGLNEVPQTPQTATNMSFHFSDSAIPSSSPASLGIMPPQTNGGISPHPLAIPQHNTPVPLHSQQAVSFPSPPLAGILSNSYQGAPVRSTSSYMDADALLPASMSIKSTTKPKSKSKSKSPSTNGKVAKRSSSKSRKPQKTQRRTATSKSHKSKPMDDADVVSADDNSSDDSDGLFGGQDDFNDDMSTNDNDDSREVDENDDSNMKIDSDISKEEDPLRKPANAFILYRQAKNSQLRTEKPSISVEAASTIIGKSWREETEEVKNKFKELARIERDKYFAKKKRVMALQKLKKIEREEMALMPQGRQATKNRRMASGSQIPGHLMIATARELSSYAPEALAKGPKSPLAKLEPQSIPSSQQNGMRVPTLGFGSSLDDSALMSSSLGSNHAGFGLSMSRMDSDIGLGLGSTSNPDIGSYFIESSSIPGLGMTQEMSRHVASSVERLTIDYNNEHSLPGSMTVDQSAAFAGLGSRTSDGGNSAALMSIPDSGDLEAFLNSMQHS
ncbi:hypothetical protein GGI07_001787 [Coemansia sp. Benny D115]|nr:hypothetical protein GGI07_001787 [Coemansia sp. Benny D115]